ncbi:asparagine synthetase A [Streptomyces sp. NL15-2K]|uniref:asparagine synthetase A n=1 Tax=Streptomyces sp. NL15-2K TaxID=376149 RepID=UPI000FFB00FB|nr:MULTISPECIES: asparagine synthetase A [Actinomycetes]WKX06045.1 asparagine synthetase A [Kutzneria buriramensis]GCB52694.1 asparaginyl-tRNA synthetase-related protein [Streptomyces sp. NL15-2K]
MNFLSATENDLTPPNLWAAPEAHRAIAADSGWYQMLTTIYGALFETTVDFYRRLSIMPVLMPITVSSVSSPMGLGSDSLPVSVNILGDQTYLADSMQFQLEFILRHGPVGAYYVMPTFRGEDPDATHLNQFFHSEAEISGGLTDVMTLVEDYFRALARGLLEHPVHSSMEKFSGSLAHLQVVTEKDEFPRITFDAAMEMLGSSYFKFEVPDAPTINRAGEQELIKRFDGPVWLTHPPHLSVPFYQKFAPNGRADCADLLAGLGEVVGCGARHGTADDTLSALAVHAVDPDDYSWYLEMKRTHPLETAGFGMGLERYLMWALQHGDIRDMHVMPRLKGVPASL